MQRQIQDNSLHESDQVNLHISLVNGMPSYVWLEANLKPTCFDMMATRETFSAKETTSRYLSTLSLLSDSRGKLENSILEK